MQRSLLVVLVACGAGARPTPPIVPLVAVGDWQVSPSEPFRGKQDDLMFPSAAGRRLLRAARCASSTSF